MGLMLVRCTNTNLTLPECSCPHCITRLILLHCPVEHVVHDALNREDPAFRVAPLEGSRG